MAHRLNPTRPARHPATFLILALLTGALFFSPAGAADLPWKSTPADVDVRGVVVDDAGQPVAGATVLLDLLRESFSLRSLDREASAPVRMPAITDADGRFRFDLQPDDHFNRYEISIGVETRREGQPGFEILETRDISAEVAQGGDIDLRLRLRQAGFLRWLATYREGRASADETRLFREQGRPDRVHRASDGVVSWWYFGRGQVYYLRSGRLTERQSFDPIPDAA